MKKLFSNCTGLNVRAENTRIEYDLERGTTDLVSAYNVVIEKDLSVVRRRSFDLTSIVTWTHSLFSDGKHFLGVQGTSLFQFGTDFSSTLIRADLELGLPMYYCSAADRVYFSNGKQKGFVHEGISYVWDKPASYTGPSSYKRFSGPPNGTLMEVFGGRMYMAEGSVLWYSEPFAYNLWDRARGFIWFKTGVQMVRGVYGHLYVSDEYNVYHLPGNSPKTFEYQQISDFPAIRGTSVKVDGGKIGKGFAGMCIIWTAMDGIWLGSSTGETVNLTKDKIQFPPSLQGSAAILGNKYVVILN